MKLSTTLTSLFVMTTSALSIRSARADGVEFQLAPIDVDQKCTSIVLQGTGRFQGTMFVVPKVFLSVDANGQDLFEIIQDADGSYLLRLGIYIPLDPSKASQYRVDKNQLISTGCDFETLRADVAKGPLPIRLSALPISKIEFRVDGVDEPYTVGHGGGEYVDYIGADKPIEFKIGSKEKLNAVLSRLDGRIGLGLSARMYFGARSSSNYLSVTIDSKQLAASLGASLSGIKAIAPVDLAAKVAFALGSLNINVYREGGANGSATPDVLSDLAQSLIQQYAGIVPGKTDDKKKKGGDDGGDKKDGGDDGDGGKKDAGNGGGKSAVPGADAVAAVTPPESGGGGAGTVNVSAFVGFLNSRQKLDLSYQILGDIEEHSTFTSTLLRGDIEDGNDAVWRIASTNGQAALPGLISAGEKLEMSFTNLYRNQFASLSTATRYLTKEEVLTGLPQIKGLFKQMKGAETNKIVSLPSGGGIGAYYAPSWFSAIWSKMYSVAVKTISIGFTGEMQTNSIDITEKGVKNLPLSFSFSRVGARKFALAELFQTNPYFDVSYDTFRGVLTLAALKDLGLANAYFTGKVPTTTYKDQIYVLKTNSILSETWSTSTHFAEAGGVNKTTPAYNETYEINVRRELPTMRVDLQPGKSTDGVLVVPTRN